MLLSIPNKEPGTCDYAKIRDDILAAAQGGDWGVPWPLPNLKPSTEMNFWGWRSSYGFKAEIWAGHKQVGAEWPNLMVYYLGHSEFIDGGFAVLVFRHDGKERVEYYEWSACDHSFCGKNVGNCLNKYTCEKCGKSYEVDSSG